MNDNPSSIQGKLLDALMLQLRAMLPNIDWEAEPQKEPIPIRSGLPLEWSDLPGVAHFAPVATAPKFTLGAAMTQPGEEPMTWVWWRWKEHGESPVEAALMLAHNFGFSYALRTVSNNWPHGCNPFCDLTPEQRDFVRANLGMAEVVAANATPKIVLPEIYQEVDGHYYFAPPPNAGAYSAHDLRAIAAKLDAANAEIIAAERLLASEPVSP